MGPRGEAARRTPRRAGFRPGRWALRHLQAALGSLGGLARAPLGTLMTVAVLGIALALPAGLLVTLANLQQLGERWEGPATISLFLADDLDDEAAGYLAEWLRGDPAVGGVQLIGRAEALEEFRRHSGFGTALDALADNPLPAVLLVRPAEGQDGPETVMALNDRLQELPEVASALLDLQWVQRLKGITEVARRGAWIVAALLALAVLLIVGNTIRLEIQNRRDEILISKLVGATDAFVRRPFLYRGFWLGLTGGLGAWLLLALALLAIEPPVTHLAGLYQSDFRLRGLGAVDLTALLGGGALIGWLGAWLSVGRHLSAIEPE